MDVVPAAFASTPSNRVSDRYSFISTSDIVDELRDRGWQPVRATQNRRGDMAHGTHRINFRQPDIDYRGVGDVVPEISLLNNHMGLSKARLFAAMFRLACSNGMVVATGMVTQAVVIHRGEASIEIDGALDEATETLGIAAEQIRDWRGIELGQLQRVEFAREAGLIRGHQDGHFNPHAFLTTRRSIDEGSDLWTTLNVVQENVIRGGVRAGSNRRRLRGITNVSEDQRINTALWELADNFAKRIRDGQSQS